jgi:hypothetical protein
MVAFTEAILTIFICEQPSGERYELAINFGKSKTAEPQERELTLSRVGSKHTEPLWKETTRYLGQLALSANNGKLTVWRQSEGKWVPLFTVNDSTYTKGRSGMEAFSDYGLTTGHPHVTRFWAAGETKTVVPSTIAAGPHQTGIVRPQRTFQVRGA